MAATRTTFRLNFRTKVLAPVAILLVAVTVLTLLIVTRTIGQQTLAGAERSLRTADAVFQQSLALHQRSLLARYRNAVNEPRFRAVAQLDDRGTMDDFLKQTLVEYGDGAEALVFFNDQGRLRGAACNGANPALEAFARKTRAMVERGLANESSVAVISWQQRTFTIVTVPAMAQDRVSTAGVLAVAIPFGDQAIREMESLTQTEIALLVDDVVAVSSLPLTAVTTALRESNAPQRNAGPSPMRPVLIDGEHYFSSAGEFGDELGGTRLRYVLFASYEQRLKELNATRLSLIAVSVLALLGAIILIGLAIRQVTQPLVLLRDSAEKVGSGDLSIRVPEVSDDECGDLAVAFNGMIGSIAQSRREIESTVSALETTQAQLRSNEEQLRLIFESATDHMIVSYDGDGRVRSWNNGATQQLGYSTADASGMHYSLFFCELDRAAGLPERLLRTAESESRAVFEGWRVRRDGTRFWADITVSPLLLSDGQRGFVEIARDVTERRQTAEAMVKARDAAESANRAKTEFLANMSHELRTPMNAIIGMSAMLQDRVAAGEDSESVHTIRASAGHLLGLIDDILEIARIETGKIEIVTHPFDPVACLEQLVDRFADAARAKGLELSSHALGVVPALIQSDERRLRQVLSALLSNAVKFTDRGSVRISLTVAKEAGRDSLIAEVRDTGIGIDGARRDRLFKSFSQVESSSQRRFGGLGIGLAISDAIVTAMGGQISVESSPGLGSCFTVKLPLVGISGATPEFAALKGKRTLIVADTLERLKDMETQLVSWQVDVQGVVGGEREVREWQQSGGNCDVLVRCTSRGKDLSSGTPIAGAAWVQPLLRDGPPFDPNAKGIPWPLKPTHLARALGELTKRPTEAPEAIAKNFAQRHPMRILVVEDNPVNSKVALMLLKRLGYDAAWVENGALGLERMLSGDFDFVFMDLQMPTMDGLEATRRFREVHDADELPFICALTANALKEDRDACQAVGMHHFLAKPIQMPTLTAALESASAWLKNVAAAKA